MKKRIIGIIGILITFITATFIVSTIILNSDKILNSFSIINVDNKGYVFSLNFEKVKAASYYEVVIYNENNQQVFVNEYEDTNINLDLNMLQYDSEYRIVIYAYDKENNSKSVNNPYTFTYTEPTFSLESDLILNDEEDYELIIDGDLSSKDYKILILDNDYVIFEDELKDNTYTIDKKYYQNMMQKLDIEIRDENISISKISLFNKMSPVSDIKITNPENGSILDYNDVILTYEGGDNATSYMVEIYEGKRLIKSTSVRKNRAVVSSSFFEKSKKYKIVVKALYNDYEEYTKTSQVEFEMNEKDTLKPAYINRHWKNVKKGTTITLNNPNDIGNIYYTIDGSDPTVEGKKYIDPIVINKNTLIKAVVMEPNMNNSFVTEYNVSIGEKDLYKVYLSPSNQIRNIGVASTGYTNERVEMNDLTNYIEKRLQGHNIKLYRNSPYSGLNQWVADSRYLGVDLHLAIHSNASINHNVFGIETWIDEESSPSYSLANLFQNALLDIYYTEEEGSNRGVKYAFGAFGEVNQLYVPFGVLLEIAHHDYEKDAAWIMQNKELIANTIADTILKYFGLI